MVAAVAIVGPAFGASPGRGGGEQQDVPKAVKRLWSQYPLNPSKPRSEQPRTRPEPARIHVAETRPIEGGEPGGGIPRELLAATAVALGLLAFGVFALRHGALTTAAGTSRRGLRSRLAPPAVPLSHGSTRVAVPNSPNDGGHPMSNFRRTRKSKDETDRIAQRSAEKEQTATEKFAAYSVGSAAETDAGTDEPAAETTVASGVQDEPGPRGDDAAYEQVGEQVTEVLTSAHQAAKRLRASAAEEVERVRREADDYATTTRAAADQYADERRAAAETEAGQIISDAAQSANAVREAAQKDAVEAQRDAVERRQTLLEETERTEERLQNLLQVFRAMTQRLETLVGNVAQGEADDRSDAEAAEAGKDLADALELPRPRDSESRSSAAR
jgi:vacuolar-type H+-ATPase subunit E/Vma4